MPQNKKEKKKWNQKKKRNIECEDWNQCFYIVNDFKNMFIIRFFLVVFSFQVFLNAYKEKTKKKQNTLFSVVATIGFNRWETIVNFHFLPLMSSSGQKQKRNGKKTNDFFNSATWRYVVMQKTNDIYRKSERIHGKYWKWLFDESNENLTITDDHLIWSVFVFRFSYYFGSIHNFFSVIYLVFNEQTHTQHTHTHAHMNTNRFQIYVNNWYYKRFRSLNFEFFLKMNLHFYKPFEFWILFINSVWMAFTIRFYLVVVVGNRQ